MARKKTRKKGTKKKRTGRKTAKKKTSTRVARRRGRRSKLASHSVAELQAELERRRQQLQDRRDELQEEMDLIDGQLSEIGAAPRARQGRRPGRPARSGTGRRTGRRPRNKVKLVDALEAVLRNKTMSVAEASDAVQRAGYKTKSANFRVIVNQALINNSDRFKKIARGQYTAK